MGQAEERKPVKPDQKSPQYAKNGCNGCSASLTPVILYVLHALRNRMYVAQRIIQAMLTLFPTKFKIKE